MIQSLIPSWLQWAWAIAGLGVAAGGLVWILFIFWPYLRWSRRMMIRSFELASDTSKVLERIKLEVSPLIEDAASAIYEVRRMVHDVNENRKLDRAIEGIGRIAFYLQLKTWTEDKDFAPIKPKEGVE